MGEHRATLAAVAARAGVSPSTASLAFSGSGPVAESTRERVLAAARELGYAGPDPLARSLRRGRSGIVGAVVGERLLYAFRDPVAVALLDGIAEALSPSGTGLLLLSGDAQHGSPTPEQVSRMPVDAVVFATCGRDDDPLLDLFIGRGVPVVAIDGPDRPEVTLLRIDDYGGALDLAKHVAGLGHQRVAVAALPLRLDGRSGLVDDARRAVVGFADCRARLTATEDVFGRVPVAEAPSNVVEEGERTGRLLLSAPRRPTAIIAQSDLLAVGVIRAAEALGLRVPDDLTVVGYDGIDTPWLGDRVLTTVVQPMVEKGQLTGRMVTELLAGRRPADVHLPVHLRVGATSAPPPA
ncbi:LacI family DNA-binding transcriptional regulator [Jiangella alba]|uniref:DNA-binding transcriptional regulator, LacI/PurR family n=1 Tax=Jiangella alba TaxID=561176 RepID=A0A1H5PR13_9ACTN|nr:LacI family DNA-binding transcriptional regulator [Jiangella alba]SEF16159.1 DNA-binding transcriptional regulator, LacI/PurR family [Jiangella alba]